MVGYEAYREAAATAIRDLGLTALVIDDQPSTPDSPRAACLHLVAEADLFILMTGDRYGYPLPPTNVSATHQEFREAQRLRKPILVFVHDGVDEDASLMDFRREAEDWSAGALRSLYTTPNELRSAITSSLHRLLQESCSRRSRPRRSRWQCCGTRRETSVYGTSPAAAQLARGWICRPALVRPFVGLPRSRAEQTSLVLLSSTKRIVALADGCRTETTPQSIKLFNDSLSFTISSLGDIVIELSLEPVAGADHFANQLGAIVEEDVVEGMELAFRAAITLLDLIDSSRSLTWCGIAAAIDARDYASWTNRARITQSSGTMRVSMNQRSDSPVMPRGPATGRPRRRQTPTDR